MAARSEKFEYRSTGMVDQIELPETIRSLGISIEHISFMVTVFTAISVFWAFWKFENLLWNRVSYRIGLWVFSRPYYEDTEAYPTGPYMHEMITTLTIMSILVFAYSIFATILITILVRKGTATKKSYLSLTGISFLVFLMAWWAEQSFWVSPNNWFRLELAQLHDEYWKAGILSLPMATDKEGFLFIVFRFAEISALLVLSYNLGIDFIAYREYRRELKEKTIARETTVWTFRRVLRYVLFYTVMLLFLVFTLFPVIYTFLVSISSEAALRNQNLADDPIKNFVLNYSSVIFTRERGGASFQTAFRNSIFLGVGTAIGGLSISLPAAYAIARFRFSSKRPIEFLILATQMFPGIILLIPQFLIWRELGLLSTENRRLYGTLLAYFAGSVAYTVWMMKGYFETIPRDLEEAALIDGSSNFGAFARISLPLAAPGMVAVGIFTFLGAWNEFALAQIFIGENKPTSPLPLLFYSYQDTSAPDNKPFFQLLAAYSMLVALPIIILFMSLQRLLARGATAGGVK